MPQKEGDFDKFVEELQQEIIDREVSDFNEHVVNLFHKPTNWGKPSNFTVSHSHLSPRKKTMEFYLTIKNGIIEKANFFTDGCGATVATGSQTTLLIEGKNIDFAENLKPEDINDALHGLPEDHKHSLDLAVTTLRDLITNFKKNRD